MYLKPGLEELLQKLVTILRGQHPYRNFRTAFHGPSGAADLTSILVGIIGNTKTATSRAFGSARTTSVVVQL